MTKIKIEEGQDVLKIEETEIVAETGRKWTEEIQAAGQEIGGHLKRLWNAGKNRRIVVRNQMDEVVLNLPILILALGIAPPLAGLLIILAVIFSAAALMKKCTIGFERRFVENEAKMA